MAHSPLPLTYENKGTYITSRIDGDPYVVARVDFGLPVDVYQANAEFIVKACNSHYDMLAALEELVDLAAPNIYPQPDKPDTPWGKLERARAAIAQAKGQS